MKRVADNLPRGLGVRAVRPAQVARVLSRASRPQGVHGPAGAAAPLIGLCRGFDIAGDLALRRRRLRLCLRLLLIELVAIQDGRWL